MNDCNAHDFFSCLQKGSTKEFIEERRDVVLVWNNAGGISHNKISFVIHESISAFDLISLQATMMSLIFHQPGKSRHTNHPYACLAPIKR